MAEEERGVRRQPYNEDAERAVIGAMLMDRDAVMAAVEILKGEDFYFRRYQVIFEAIAELNTSGMDADLVTVQDRLREKDIAPEIASFDFLRSLIEEIPTSANIRSYANIVWEKAVLRRLIKAADSISADAYLGKDPLDDILARTEEQIFNIARTGSADTYVPVSKIAMDVFEKIEEASRSKSRITGLATGYPDLDYKLSGLQKSDLILVGARPSVGKTAFALNIAHHIAVKAPEKKRKNVAIFSLEMSKEQLVNRLLAMESGINSQDLRTGQLDAGQWQTLTEAVTAVGKSGLIIDDTSSLTVQKMRSKCMKFDLDCGGLDLIIVDYLQLMTSESSRRSENRQTEVSAISRGLKGLARELNVPLIALSQLNRAAEGRDKPILADLRESGSIEQDADVVMLMHRDNQNTEHPGLTEINIAKQRNGPIGPVNLMWLPETTRFVSTQTD